MITFKGIVINDFVLNQHFSDYVKNKVEITKKEEIKELGNLHIKIFAYEYFSEQQKRIIYTYEFCQKDFAEQDFGCYIFQSQVPLDNSDLVELFNEYLKEIKESIK